MWSDIVWKLTGVVTNTGALMKQTKFDDPVTLTLTSEEWYGLYIALESYLKKNNTADPRLQEEITHGVYMTFTKLSQQLAKS